MTPELQARWKAGLAPFDGSTVASCDDPELDTMLNALRFAQETLRDSYPNIAVFSDWHEHDGFLVNPRVSYWEEVGSWLVSIKTLYESRDRDDFVRIAIVPDSFEWLLRYNIEDAEEDYKTTWCDFDYSSTPVIQTAHLVNEIHSKWPGFTDILPAKEYFDQSYGG